MRLVMPLALAVASVFSFLLLHATARPAITDIRPAVWPANSIGAQPEGVWLVEQAGDSETYSNGLRIDSRWAVRNHPRSYRRFPAASERGKPAGFESEPAGIVFHTTESMQLPFEPGESQRLQQLGESLLAYVQRRRAYHFLIDRFGRVYRVVAEEDAANHAGYSVWADRDWLYVNLNESFLGVAFEAQTRPGQTDPEVSPAQLRAGAMLVEMVRSRYHIAAGNCVTHAQVSVNPSNMRVGYHTDWSSSFPFEALGLPDNYALALPALWAFGFEYDSSFVRTAGARLSASVHLAEEVMRRAAAQAGISQKSYRAKLRRRYREKLAAVLSHEENK